MLQQLNNTIIILQHALRLAWRRPVVLAPLVGLWVLYVPLVSYLAFHADVRGIPPFVASLLLFLVPIAMHFGLALTAASLSRITKDLETNRPAAISDTIRDIFAKHKYKLALLGLVGGAINMLIIMIQAVHAPESGGIPDTLRAFSPENLARILLSVGSDNILTLEAMKFAMVKKAVRLTIFFAVPAIILSRKAKSGLFERALYVIDRNVAVTIGGLVLTTLAVFILSLPAAYVIQAQDMGLYTLPDAAWYALMLYAGFLWVVMLYLEQAFCLTLFRWQDARDARGPKTTLNEAPRPNLGGI